MVDKKSNEGISVQELENFGKKYRFEIFFVIYFLLASLMTFFFFGAVWSIYLGGLGGILGVWLSTKIEKSLKAGFNFVFKQDQTTQIILAVVGVVISFFLSPLIFLILGLAGGSAIHKTGSNLLTGNKENQEK